MGTNVTKYPGGIPLVQGFNKKRLSCHKSPSVGDLSKKCYFSV